MHDHLTRAIAANGRIRAVACLATALANDISFLQGGSPVVSIAMGRALAGAALLASTLKHGQRLALRFEGNGPMKRLIAEADWDGALRGTVACPDAMADTVQAAIGRAGFLTVTKDLGMKEPYSGMVQLCTSEIGEDLAYYLTDSEQIPSAVGLHTTLARDGQIAVCGGFLVQSLPPADESAVERVMAKIEQLPPLGDMLKGENAPAALLKLLLEGLDCKILETMDLRFHCGCSRQKVERAILSLGLAELGRLIEEEGEAQVTCEYCKRGYSFARGELEALSASYQA